MKSNTKKTNRNLNKRSTLKKSKNKINYVVAVPSYKRYEILRDKTLKLLKSKNINSKSIYIFVANNEEKILYEKVLDKSKYNKIVVGEKGLENQRNFISSYFDENQFIIQIDDDINDLMIIKDSKNHIREKHILVKLKNLDKFIKNAYMLMKKHNIYLFGIYPIDNPYFMSNRISTKLKLVVGGFFGMINRKSDKFKLDIDEKDDVLLTLLHYKEDGRILRFNNVCFKTTYYKGPGGMQEHKKNRKEETLKSAKLLAQRFPKLTKLNLKKKSGYGDVVLKIQNIKI